MEECSPTLSRRFRISGCVRLDILGTQLLPAILGWSIIQGNNISNDITLFRSQPLVSISLPMFPNVVSCWHIITTIYLSRQMGITKKGESGNRGSISTTSSTTATVLTSRTISTYPRYVDLRRQVIWCLIENLAHFTERVNRSLTESEGRTVG